MYTKFFIGEFGTQVRCRVEGYDNATVKIHKPSNGEDEYDTVELHFRSVKEAKHFIAELEEIPKKMLKHAYDNVGKQMKLQFEDQ